MRDHNKLWIFAHGHNIDSTALGRSQAKPVSQGVTEPFIGDQATSFQASLCVETFGYVAQARMRTALLRKTRYRGSDEAALRAFAPFKLLVCVFVDEKRLYVRSGDRIIDQAQKGERHLVEARRDALHQHRRVCLDVEKLREPEVQQPIA